MKKCFLLYLKKLAISSCVLFALISEVVKPPHCLAQEAYSPTPLPSQQSSTPLLKTEDSAAHFYVFGLGLGLGVGGAVSWKFHRTWTGEFTTVNEGWFEKDSYTGGADKIGHFYTDFVLVRAFHHIYQTHGYSENDSIWYGYLGSMLTRSVMEIADGFTTFKFSPQDLIANMTGSTFSALILKYPKLDRIIGFSWSYLPSTEKLDGKVEYLTIDNDYNGSVYHLDVKLAGLLSDQSSLRPYNVGISYYTRGYDRQRDSKSRMIGLTVGLNLDQMLKDEPTTTSWNKTQTLVKYFKIPFSFAGYYYDLDQHSHSFRYGLSYFY